jgi:hypothetical protein
MYEPPARPIILRSLLYGQEDKHKSIKTSIPLKSASLSSTLAQTSSFSLRIEKVAI